MTEQEAIQKALDKRDRWGKDYLVCNRTSRGVYVIAKNEKRLWADDETLVFDTSHPASRMEVSYDGTGDTVIRVDSVTAARLAGRTIFGRLTETQHALEDAICDAWYAADCPS